MFLIAGVCYADVPKREQECRIRNSALCEINGVPYLVEGPCPSTATIIRPPGRERCDDLPRERATVGPSHPGTGVPGGLPAPRQDLAWVGRIERWLLPALVVTGGAIIAGLVILTCRWAWVRRNAGDTVSRTARTVLRLVIAAGVAVLAAYYAAGAAFTRIFSSFDNHDTAAPALLAAPAALAVFLLVLTVVFALSAWVLGAILKTGSRSFSDDPQ